MAYEYGVGAYSLFVDYEKSLVRFSGNGYGFGMRLAPYILFSDGRRADFPAPCKSLALDAATSFDVRAEYEDFEGSRLKAFTCISLEKATGDLRFEIRIEGDEPGEISFVAYPSAWQNEGENAYTALPRRQGELIPKSSTLTYEKARIFENSAYMPMFGQYNDKGAYLAVYDTPCDASYDYKDGEIAPLWRPSLGTLRYQRRMLYRLTQGDYNDIAREYRAYIKAKGQLITLKAKAALNPLVERLAGCPIIHTTLTRHVEPTSRYYRPNEPEYNDSVVTFDARAEQIRALKRKGLDRAYTHFDGWGFRGYDNLHPSPLPPSPAAGGLEGMLRLQKAVKDCGYLFGLHDQYRDYYYDAPGFNIDEARQNLDGSHSHNHIWNGGHYAYLCAEMAVKYVRRNYIELARMGITPDSSYLDVFSLAELDECFNPDHYMSREQSVYYRRECFDILTSMGIIPSSEETLDCVLPSQVLCHHAPFNRDEIASTDLAIGIPLFNLVYHDCVIIPWIGLPNENGDSGLSEPMSTYLYAMLNGNPVYCPIDADERTIEAVKRACKVSEKLMYAAMARHELLNASGTRQRAVFDDGSVTYVDMEKGEFILEGEKENR